MPRLKHALILLLALLALLVPFRPQSAAGAEGDAYSLRWELFREGGDGGLLAVLWLDPGPGRHAYANPSGQAGMPMVLSVALDGGAPLPVVYPEGKAVPDAFDPALTVRIYEGPTPIFVRLGAPPEDARALSGTLSMGVCSEANCLPVREELSLPLTGVDRAALPDARDYFWYRFHLGADAKAAAPGVAAPPAGVQDLDLAPRYFRPELEVTSLWPALGLALLAGFILNFMPCVLPVVSLKLSALLAGAAEEDKEERKRAFREHNLFFSAGVLAYFLFLGGLLSALGLAWGELFQSPGLILGLAAVVFALALALFGVWNLPVIDLKAGSQSGSPRLQALFTGVLATLLATPCSGPFLGGVLGWVLLQPPPVILAVFLAIGLGMAAPFLIMCARPGLVRLFPRPGAWMGYLEAGVGFFLLGTVLYLLSILPRTMLLPALTLLLAVAFASWIWGKWAHLSLPAPRRLGLRLIALALVALAAVALFGRAPTPDPWQRFDAPALRAALGQGPVVVDFTADWCPNCKLLEHTALSPDNLAGWRARFGLTLVQVDLTREHPEGLALLRALGSQSIPVVAVFPPGDGWRSPLVLRDLFTAAQMEQALKEALDAP
ncbi:protein-disulfide reductase DsbD family protein [Desulfocurvus sp. DL9XJH121]